MKKNNLFYLVVLSGLFIGGFLQAAEPEALAEEEVILPEYLFEDKPALSWAEQALLWGAKGIGAAGTGLVGIPIGGGTSYITYKGWKKMRGVRPLPQVPDVTLHQGKNQGATEMGEIFRRGAPGAVIGAGLGTYAGYRGGEWAAIRLLAQLHGVNPRIEMVSQYYNINVPQYRPLLVAAENQNKKHLLEAIHYIYSQRFGSNWAKRLQKLFKKYHGKAQEWKISSFSQKGDIKDFLRLVELGAALNNLYSNTLPNWKNRVDLAIELYSDLGLL